MTYFHIKLQNVKAEDEDFITQLCFDYSAAGVSEDLDFTQTADHYEPVTVEKPIKTLNVFFEQRPVEPFFLSILENYPTVEVVVSEEENKDWLEEWKKGLEAFPLAGPYWVVPSWLETPVEAERPIVIDPGMAFGTGTHETTQIAAQLIYEQQAQVTEGLRVLDVGTGTAILAILTRMMGAASVIATEIDEQARAVARENVTQNQQTEVRILDEQIDSLVEPFDWVIANIIDGVLIRIQKDLKRLGRPGGLMCLTGILQEREEHFLQKFTLQESFKILKCEPKGEWLGFVVKRERE